MDLRTYAEQRLVGVPTSERGCYTKAVWAIRRWRWGLTGEDREPTVEELRRMSDQEILAQTQNFGPIGLGYLRELLGQ